jgi:hypothetical protein
VTQWIAPTDELVGQAWQQSSTLSPELLALLVAAAQEGCEAYAPALQLDELGEPIIPSRYKLAVIQQARETWNAGKRDGDIITTDAYAARARELTAAVRQLLRPKRGRPGIG